MTQDTYFTVEKIISLFPTSSLRTLKTKGRRVTKPGEILQESLRQLCDTLCVKHPFVCTLRYYLVSSSITAFLFFLTSLSPSLPSLIKLQQLGSELQSCRCLTNTEDYRLERLCVGIAWRLESTLSPSSTVATEQSPQPPSYVFFF